MDVDTVTNLLKETSDMQMDNLDFQRKLIQGKSIFDFNTLSDEEKQVVQLMNSFTSLEEKQKFLQLVQEQLGVDPVYPESVQTIKDPDLPCSA